MKKLLSLLSLILLISSCDLLESLNGNEQNDKNNYEIYAISSEDLNGWEEGYTDGKNYMVAVPLNDSDSTLFMVNSSTSPEEGLYFLYDENGAINGFGTTSNWYLTTETEEGIVVNWMDEYGNMYGEIINSTSRSDSKAIQTKSTKSANNLFSGDKIEKICDILGNNNSNESIFNNANNHEWHDLAGDLIDVAIDVGLDKLGDLRLKVAKFIVGIIVDELNSGMYERQRNAMYANCTTEITEIIADELGTLNVFVTIKNASSVPTHLVRLYYNESEEATRNNVSYGVVGRRTTSPTAYVYTNPYKVEQILNRNTDDELYLMFTFPKPTDFEVYCFKSYLKSNRLADHKGNVNNKQIKYSKTHYYRNISGYIDDFKQVSYSSEGNTASFKCTAHATCYDTPELVSWGLYYQDDSGKKTIFHPKTYDEPSIGNPNSADFEINIDIPSEYLKEGYKDIQLGIYALTNQSLAVYYSTPQIFTLKVERPTPGQWVDLGLPSGIKWAGWNVGASAPEEYGGYFAWGETSEKSVYDFKSHQHKEKHWDDHDGWYWTYSDIGECISGTNYDVAAVRWGGGARMPTVEEIMELEYECSWENGYVNGVEGIFAIGPNGNSIFIPFAGYRDYSGLRYEGHGGYLWSGTLFDPDHSAYRLGWYYYDASWYYYWFRYCGLSVRPVSD